MQYWLFKSEPFKWSWDKQVAAGPLGQQWDGVRNYQARNNMRAMALGDRGFFYHSNEGLCVAGIVEVCALAHRDTTTDDERWECVDIRALAPIANPVSLAAIKAEPALSAMALVANSRLSVQPVKQDEWRHVCAMGGINPNTLKPGALKQT